MLFQNRMYMALENLFSSGFLMCQNDSHDLTLLGIWVSFPILDQAICLTCKNSAGIHWKAILASTSFALCYHYSSINLRNCYPVLQFELYIPWGQHMLYLCFFFAGINYCSTFRLSAEQTFWIDLPVVPWHSLCLSSSICSYIHQLRPNIYFNLIG